MTRFILLGQTASATPDFSLDDVPGTSGRLDVLLRCIGAAMLVSHGLRRDAVVYMVLSGRRVVKIDGAAASYLRPDERAMAGRVKAMLATAAEPGAWSEARQGMAVADGGLDRALSDVSASLLYVLDEEGDDVRDVPLPEDSTFVVGDHLGFDAATRERLRVAGARPVRVGPVSLHADDAIAVLWNELDRRRSLRS